MAAIRYLIAQRVTKDMNGQRLAVLRDPAPEVLISDPRLVLAAMQLLESKHRYSVATLSFDRSDIDVAAFNAGHAASRMKVGQTLDLFFHVAYAGLPQRACLHPLVGTHTHTGRLEVNIMLPRTVLKADGSPRAYNANPPGRGSRSLWDSFRDTVNGRFGWADPLSPLRKRDFAMPDRQLKQRREAERNGNDPGADLRDRIIEIAAAHLDYTRIFSREMLLDAIAPELSELGIRVKRKNLRTTTFTGPGLERDIRLSGYAFSDFFREEDPRHSLSMGERLIERADELRRAPSLLAEGMERRAALNRSRLRYHYPDTVLERPGDILSGPGLSLPACHQDHLALSGTLFRQRFKRAANRIWTERDGETAPWSEKVRISSDLDIHRSPLSADARSAGTNKITRRIGELFRRLLGRLIERQASHLLAKSLLRLDQARWRSLEKRLESMNGKEEGSAGELGGARSGHQAPDSADRPVGNAFDAGEKSGYLGPDRAVHRPDPARGGPDGSRGDGAGGRSGNAAESEAYRDADPGADTRYIGNEKRSFKGLGGAGPAAGNVIAPPTRAELIRRVAEAAAQRGQTMPRVSFVVYQGQEMLRGQTPDGHFLYDGSRALDFNRDGLVRELRVGAVETASPFEDGDPDAAPDLPEL
ncbi:hypothetical protein [Martelella endophytica]|uniref:hypothetical protein n=1 Tax=Martelella endophytica TaxID=1486262 RepID=UPI000A905B04|nr:hypothetical protein [Martelella endophytica]